MSSRRNDTVTQFFNLIAPLADPVRRREAAQRLAAHLGADALILFISIPATTRLVPAPGFEETFLDTPAWQTFLAGFPAAKYQTASLPFSEQASLISVEGHRTEDGSVLALIGGAPKPEWVGPVTALVPLIAAAVLAAPPAAAGPPPVVPSSGIEGRHSDMEKALLESEESKRALQVAHRELATHMALVQRQLEIAELLHWMSNRFALGEKLDAFMKELIIEVANITNSSKCVVCLIEERQLIPFVSHGFNEEVIRQITLPISQDEKDILYRVLYRGETLMFDPISSRSASENYRKIIERLDIHSTVAVPLQVRGDPIGALFICDNSEGNTFSTDRVQFLETIANQIAIAIANAKYYDNLQKTNEELWKKTVEAQEASRLKSEFLSNMSHELRTPLHAIIGYGNLIIEDAYGPLHEEQRSPLESLLRNADELLTLINDLLDLAKIESGKMPLRVEPIDITAVLMGVYENLKPLVQKKNLAVQWDLGDSDNPLWVIQSDPAKVRQIFLNILSNAIKYTEKGFIRISAKNNLDKKGILISVEDTGIGMREEDLPRIFDRFRQIDGSLTRNVGGTGLGLNIVKSALQLIGGTIRVRSTLGKGSTFTIFIPSIEKATPPTEVAIPVESEPGP